MNRYLVASLMPLALLSQISFASVQAHDRAHRARGHIVAATRVNINTADEKQLASLAGVGDKKAQAIIAYRQSHGHFTSVNDLKNVKGIGGKRFHAIMKQGLAYTTTSKAP